MLGIFAFIATQPAQADRIGSAKGSLRGSMTGATNDYTFSVMTNMVTIGDATFTPTPTTGMVDVSNASVTARPADPGDLAQITVMFETNEFLAIGEAITLEVADDLGVPSSINAADVSISGPASAGAGQPTTQEVASPRSIIVGTDAVEERYVITLNIGNMDDSADRATDKGLAAGDVTVTFRQGAGLTNRTEGGSDEWYVKTSAESTLAEIGDVYSVPWTISLSSYADSRGEEIIAVGRGFKNGTTTYFWRDADRDGNIGAGESVLCSATATGEDIAICFFTLSNPPFAPGTSGNYVNAVDGRGNTAGDSDRLAEFKQIELEPSLSVSPKQGVPGDSINVQLHDFVTGDVVTRIELARTVDICDSDAATAIPTCASIGARGAVGSNGSLIFSFTIPNTVTPGAQDLRVHTTNGNGNTTFYVVDGGLQLSTTDVLPNQRIFINGSGFTKSSNQNPAYIGDPDGEYNSCPGGYYGAVTLGGQAVPWNRINDGDGIEVTSGGTWSAPIDLPINSSTTAAGIRELKITDCRVGLGTVDLTFAGRVVTMTPAEGGVGTEVVISGKNYPVRNDDGSDIEVFVLYDAGADAVVEGAIEPATLGNFTVILEVPEAANIPSSNIVTVWFYDDRGDVVLDTLTHRVPQGTVFFSNDTGRVNSNLTIGVKGFAPYTSVDIVKFGDRDITPIPKPSTDTYGNVTFNIRIPSYDPGIYIVRVVIANVVATHGFVVVEGCGDEDAEVESLGALTTPVTKTGAWAADCNSEARSGSYARYYSFTLTEAGQVEINLTSGADSYLALRQGESRDGAVVEENDNVRSRNFNSSINRMLDAGAYTVEATTYFAGQTGDFTLSVRPLQETEDLGPLTRSVDRSNSRWTSDYMSTQQGGSYARSYTFTLNAATHVVINLTSPEDPYLYVLRDGAVVHENDNVTTRNLNSRIDETLPAGRYTIEATTYFPARTGTFHLSIGYFGSSQ